MTRLIRCRQRHNRWFGSSSTSGSQSWMESTVTRMGDLAAHQDVSYVAIRMGKGVDGRVRVGCFASSAVCYGHPGARRRRTRGSLTLSEPKPASSRARPIVRQSGSGSRPPSGESSGEMTKLVRRIVAGCDGTRCSSPILEVAEPSVVWVQLSLIIGESSRLPPFGSRPFAALAEKPWDVRAVHPLDSPDKSYRIHRGRAA